MIKTKTFENIDQEMTWEMFKMSDGNPYIMQELVRERNAKREKENKNVLEK